MFTEDNDLAIPDMNEPEAYELEEIPDSNELEEEMEDDPREYDFSLDELEEPEPLDNDEDSAANAFEEEIVELDYKLVIAIDDRNDAIKMEKISGMAEIIKRDNHFVTDASSNELYVYATKGKRAGTYIEASQAIDYATIYVSSQWGKPWLFEREVTRREVYKYINSGLRKLEEPDTRHINVVNGLICLSPTGEFIDFNDSWSPDYLTTVKLPVVYDPNATCPAWDKFISEVFPEDTRNVAYELAAMLMVPLKNKAASGIILKGPKNTGKSTFQNGIISFLGLSNICSLSIDKFGERFQDTQLKGKLANIAGEIPNTKLTPRAVKVIKQLIGNDMLSGEIKHGASFMFKSYARCVFSCNEIPSCDSDDAFLDRFYVILFNQKQFDKNPVKEQELNEALSSQSELSGLLNKALRVLPTVVAHGITKTASMNEQHEIMVDENRDPLASWVTEYIEVGSYKTLFTDLHEHYKRLEPNDYRRKSNKIFGRDLKKLLPLQAHRKQVILDDGSRPYAYAGIRLRDAPEEVDQTDFMDFNLESLDDDK